MYIHIHDGGEVLREEDLVLPQAVASNIDCSSDKRHMMRGESSTGFSYTEKQQGGQYSPRGHPPFRRETCETCERPVRAVASRIARAQAPVAKTGRGARPRRRFKRFSFFLRWIFRGGETNIYIYIYIYIYI